MADVTLLPDDLPSPLPPDLQDCATTLATLMEPLPKPLQSALDDCGWVANRWCELLPFALPLKQQLMALDNPLLRLELVNDFLSQTP